MNYSPLIYAFEQQKSRSPAAARSTGRRATTHWWPWKGGARALRPRTQAAARARLIEQVAQRRAGRRARASATADYLRPSFVQPYRCQNVLIEGVTIVNSPMWEIHPVLCTNVTVRDVTIRSTARTTTAAIRSRAATC